MARTKEFDFKTTFDPKLYMTFYGPWLTPEKADQEVEQIQSMLQLSDPAKILDLACGFGRHTNRLAQKGHIVTGVDSSSGFLKMAKEDARKRDLKVRYLKKDMRKIPFRREFDFVLQLFTAFGYYSDDQNKVVLENVRRALKPGGQYLLDIANRDTIMKRWLPSTVDERGRNTMIDRMRFDPKTGKVHVRRTMLMGKRRIETRYFIRVYNYTEISRMIEMAGMCIKEAFGGWNGAPFRADSNRMILVVKKM